VREASGLVVGEFERDGEYACFGEVRKGQGDGGSGMATKMVVVNERACEAIGPVSQSLMR
jgi:hypothetical protein